MWSSIEPNLLHKFSSFKNLPHPLPFLVDAAERSSFRKQGESHSSFLISEPREYHDYIHRIPICQSTDFSVTTTYVSKAYDFCSHLLF
jgi:hypothetical protein